MRIFLAGATGALGKQLVPLLTEAGHQVTGTTRDPAKTADLMAMGAEPAVVDALDATAVRDAVLMAKPDVVVHQLTALSGNLNPRKLDRSFAATNRLRTEGLDILVAAARAAGARRIVAQSFTGWPNERTGGPIKTETDPIDPSPPKGSHDTLAAIRHVEATMTGLGDMAGVALRYGGFYGPGASAEMLDLVGGRKLPIVGGGAGILSFIHIADAAAATRLAIEGGAPGLYNIVDDEPAPVSEWLPYLARLLDAKPPLRVPAWLVRPVVGDFVIAMMTTSRGSSNAKAKRDLGWTPAYPSWRQGFPDWISGAGRCRTGRG